MMRIYFLFFFLTTLLFNAQAQTETDTLVYYSTDTAHVTTPPVFPGGDGAFARFVASRLTYPEDAKMKQIQGVVFISFIVEKDGSLSSFKVVEGKSLYPSCDQEVIRVLSTSPKWTPGMKDGVPVRTKIIQRTKFSIDASPEKKKRK